MNAIDAPNSATKRVGLLFRILYTPVIDLLKGHLINDTTIATVIHQTDLPGHVKSRL